MDESKKFFTTSEAAEKLNVHARTVRKWIDAFSDYIRPELNKRGHYLLTESGLKALRDVQEQLKTGKKTLKQVREELVKSGRWTSRQNQSTSPTVQNELQTLTVRLENVERVQQQILEVLEELQSATEAVRKKQDQLKLEIRNATFQQRLEAAGDTGKTKRKRDGVLRLSQLFR